MLHAMVAMFIPDQQHRPGRGRRKAKFTEVQVITEASLLEAEVDPPGLHQGRTDHRQPAE